MATYKEESRRDWYRDGQPNNDDLKLGCLQRIADAAEHMSKNYVRLQEDRDRFERCYMDQLTRRFKLERRVAALRGVITKLKAKQKEAPHE